MFITLFSSFLCSDALVSIFLFLIVIALSFTNEIRCSSLVEIFETFALIRLQFDAHLATITFAPCAHAVLMCGTNWGEMLT